MPIIFASSFMMFPPIIMGQLLKIESLGDSAIVQTIYDALNFRAFTYNVLYMLLIFLFAYFWVTVNSGCSVADHSAARDPTQRGKFCRWHGSIDSG
jgi:preprotein translocase subunit SecY